MAFFKCPFTQSLMREPVALEDGQVCERFAIEEWFRQGHNTSPLTGLVLESLELTPMPHMQRMIERHSQQNPNESLPDLQQVFVEQCVNTFQQHQREISNFSSSLIVPPVVDNATDYLGMDMQVERVAGLVANLATGSMTEKNHALHVLENLVIYDPGDRIINNSNAIAIRNVGGIRTLVNLLKEGTRVQQESAAFILWKIAIDENEFPLHQSGAPFGLYALLEDGTAQAKVYAQQALTALEAVAAKRRLEVQLSDEEYDSRIPVLVAQLSDEKAENVEDALEQLAAIATVDPDNPIAIKDCGAIIPTMKILRDGSMKQRESAAFLLLGIAVCGNEQDIREAGAKDALHALEFEGPSSAQYVASETLEALVGLEADARFEQAQKRAVWPIR